MLPYEYIPDDHITDILRSCQVDIVDRVPDLFCSDFLLKEFTAIWIDNPILWSDLHNGKYHDKTSKSDHIYAKRVKFWLQLYDLQQFKNDDQLNWIASHHRRILAYTLQHHIECKNSIWTIYNDIKCITRILNVMSANSIYLRYNRLMETLHNHMVELEQWNRLSETEIGRMIDFEKIQDLRDELENNWRRRLQSVGISKSYREHSNMLLISMYVLAKPERTEIMELKIIYEWCHNDKKTDFLYINKTCNQCWYVLNKWKKKHDKICIQLSNKLSKLIIESVSLYPRNYVFTHYNQIHKQAKTSTVCTRLRDMFRGYGKTVGVSSLRSSYVSWLFRTNASTAYIREAAKEMRTSYYAFMSFYRKITQSIEARKSIIKPEFDPLPALNIDQHVYIKTEELEYDYSEQNIQVQSQNHYVNNNISVCVNCSSKKCNVQTMYHKTYYQTYKSEIKERSSIYYQKHKTTIYIKTILKKLNNDETYQHRIRKSTISKWSIVYHNGKWISNYQSFICSS